jgi:hypothetical protein
MTLSLCSAMGWTQAFKHITNTVTANTQLVICGILKFESIVDQRGWVCCDPFYTEEWAVPAVTCGEIELKRTGNVHWDSEDAKGNRVAVKTSHAKDRCMVILWQWTGSKGKTQKQLCQMLVHSLQQEQKDWLHEMQKFNHIIEPYQI